MVVLYCGGLLEETRLLVCMVKSFYFVLLLFREVVEACDVGQGQFAKVACAPFMVPVVACLGRCVPYFSDFKRGAAIVALGALLSPRVRFLRDIYALP